MTAASLDPLDEAAVRKQAAHEVYTRLALASALIWTLGTFLLFITFAAGNPKPIFPAMFSMLGSLVAAAIPWVFYRHLTAKLTRTRIRAARGRAVVAARATTDSEQTGRLPEPQPRPAGKAETDQHEEGT